MSILYISPTGAGRMDGSSIDNAGTLASLNQFISRAGAGGEVLMLADQGVYQRNTQLSITCGGTEGAPVTIRGIDSSGHPMDAEIRGARAENWEPGKSTGSELFRLMSGANNLVFEDMNIRNVGNGAFRIAGDLENLTIRDVDATNVGRFVENYVSGTATTASVNGLTVQNVDIAGYSTNAIRLQYDSHDITIQNVTGDSQRQNGGLYISGVMLSGTVHDVLLSHVEMRNSFGKGSSSEYWNGDGFTTEGDTYNIRFEDTVASGNTDAGYDLKSDNTVLVRALSEGNNQNYRLWTDSITMIDSVSRDPVHYGGVSAISHVWLSSSAVVTLERFDFSDGAEPKVLFNLGQSGATLRLIDTEVPPEYEELIKIYKDSRIIYLHTPTDLSVSGGTIAENSAGGTLVGKLSVADADAGDSHTFAFAAGSHPLFQIVGDQILVKAGAILDYETSRTHTVSITATDSAGLHVTRDFTVNLTDVLDTVVSGATSGADTLVGIGGKLAGGLGNDTYIVTHTTDTVVELAGQGTDTVKTSLSSYTLGANLEHLIYTGQGNFTGTGNTANNQITGGDGADLLRGGNGNDVINGGAGNDTIYGDANRDQIHGGAGHDTIRAGTFDDKVWGDDGNDQLIGEDGNDTLYGGAGNDILTGGKSVDTLVGGDGADTYRFGHGDNVDHIDNRDSDGAPDKVQFAAGVYVDEVWLSQQGDDLVASLLGSPDQIVFESWFSGGQVDRLELADGTHLDAAGVVDLLSAMSDIGAPPMSLDALSPAQHDAVMAAMNAAWTPDLS